MRATVQVVTFNHRDIISRCLDAVQHTLGAADELLLVDNASSDGTAEFVASAYPWVRVVRSPRNLGYGGANNLGAAAARGEYLVFLNPDTEPQPGWLEALLSAVEGAPERTLATAKLLLAATPERVDTFGNQVHVSGITTSRGWGQPASEYPQPEEVAAVSGACFALTRSLFWQLGGFDERLFMYFEDTDLSLRARLAGYRCVAVPEARVLHDHRPGFSTAKLRFLERNRWWTLLKVYTWPTMAALIPVLLTSEVIAWGMAACNGPQHLLAKARAWLDLMRWLPDLPAARAGVQRTRVQTDAALLRLHPTRLPFSQAAQGAAARAGELVAALVFAAARTPTYALGAR
ncbi:MAG TPA: glycosyltransferase family 2 protein [Chloroflexota bacterium]|nr:glycosyltransferase family 2 protein [Chloroflexota bacterium]